MYPTTKKHNTGSFPLVAQGEAVVLPPAAERIETSGEFAVLQRGDEQQVQSPNHSPLKIQAHTPHQHQPKAPVPLDGNAASGNILVSPGPEIPEPLALATVPAFLLLPDGASCMHTAIGVPSRDLNRYANEIFVPVSILSRLELKCQPPPRLVEALYFQSPCSTVHTLSSPPWNVSIHSEGNEDHHSVSDGDPSERSGQSWYDSPSRVSVSSRIAETPIEQTREARVNPGPLSGPLENDSGRSRKRSRHIRGSANKTQMKLGAHDVVLGQGANNYDCEGNKLLREVVVPMYAERYKSARKRDKRAIVEQLYDYWRTVYPDGRFVTRSNNNVAVVVDHDKACGYIAERLRDPIRKTSPDSKRCHNTSSTGIEGNTPPSASSRAGYHQSRTSSGVQGLDGGVQQILRHAPSETEALMERIRTELRGQLREELMQEMTVMLESRSERPSPAAAAAAPVPWAPIAQVQQSAERAADSDADSVGCESLLALQRYDCCSFDGDAVPEPQWNEET
jgi:hypothetical protein